MLSVFKTVWGTNTKACIWLGAGGRGQGVYPLVSERKTVRPSLNLYTSGKPLQAWKHATHKPWREPSTMEFYGWGDPGSNGSPLEWERELSKRAKCSRHPRTVRTLGPFYSCSSAYGGFSCKARVCLGFALFSILACSLPQAAGCQPHQLRSPQLFQWPAFAEAPVAGWQRSDGNPCPGFQKFIRTAGHDLGPEQNTPHTRLCLWKPLQLGSSVSSIDFFLSLSLLTISKFTLRPWP